MREIVGNIRATQAEETKYLGKLLPFFERKTGQNFWSERLTVKCPSDSHHQPTESGTLSSVIFEHQFQWNLCIKAKMSSRNKFSTLFESKHHCVYTFSASGYFVGGLVHELISTFWSLLICYIKVLWLWQILKPSTNIFSLGKEYFHKNKLGKINLIFSFKNVYKIKVGQFIFATSQFI